MSDMMPGVVDSLFDSYHLLLLVFAGWLFGEK